MVCVCVCVCVCVSVHLFVCMHLYTQDYCGALHIKALGLSPQHIHCKRHVDDIMSDSLNSSML